MTFSRPGRPEELPRPEVLWGHGCAAAALYAAIGDYLDSIYRLDERGGLAFDDGGGSWWRLQWVEGGRAVLAGCDRDHSDTIDPPEPLDLLSGGPDWLPWEWLTGKEVLDWVGFVYWWDGAVWARVPYPEDVGDDGLWGWLEEQVPVEAHAVRVADCLQDFGVEADEGALTALLSRSVTSDVDRAAIESVMAGAEVAGAVATGMEETEIDVGAAVDVARRAGLLAGGPGFPQAPAGSGPPAGYRPKLVSGHDWRRVFYEAMAEEIERDRPVPERAPALEELERVMSGLVAEHGPVVLRASYLEGGSLSLELPSGERLPSPTSLFSRIEALQNVEAHPERGRWFNVIVRADPEVVEVERFYDSLPRKGRVPRGVIEHVKRRAPEWRPSWVRLTDPALLCDPDFAEFVAQRKT